MSSKQSNKAKIVAEGLYEAAIIDELEQPAKPIPIRPQAKAEIGNEQSIEKVKAAKFMLYFDPSGLLELEDWARDETRKQNRKIKVQDLVHEALAAWAKGKAFNHPFRIPDGRKPRQ